MSESVATARRRFIRADKYLQVGKAFFALYLVVVTTLLLVQQFEVQQGQAVEIKTAQDGLAKSLADNAAQQRKTQDYIRCIASALVVPVAQRDDKIFDQCGIQTTARHSTSATSPSNSSTPPPSSATQVPVSQQPTTSSPPDPDTSASAMSNLINESLKALLTPGENVLNKILGRG